MTHHLTSFPIKQSIPELRDPRLIHQGYTVPKNALNIEYVKTHNKRCKENLQNTSDDGSNKIIRLSEPPQFSNQNQSCFDSSKKTGCSVFGMNEDKNSLLLFRKRGLAQLKYRIKNDAPLAADLVISLVDKAAGIIVKGEDFLVFDDAIQIPLLSVIHEFQDSSAFITMNLLRHHEVYSTESRIVLKTVKNEQETEKSENEPEIEKVQTKPLKPTRTWFINYKITKQLTDLKSSRLKITRIPKSTRSRFKIHPSEIPKIIDPHNIHKFPPHLKPLSSEHLKNNGENGLLNSKISNSWSDIKSREILLKREKLNSGRQLKLAELRKVQESKFSVKWSDFKGELKVIPWEYTETEKTRIVKINDGQIKNKYQQKSMISTDIRSRIKTDLLFKSEILGLDDGGTSLFFKCDRLDFW
jgi:hypothetical protein